MGIIQREAGIFFGLPPQLQISSLKKLAARTGKLEQGDPSAQKIHIPVEDADLVSGHIFSRIFRFLPIELNSTSLHYMGTENLNAPRERPLEGNDYLNELYYGYYQPHQWLEHHPDQADGRIIYMEYRPVRRIEKQSCNASVTLLPPNY